MNYTGALSLRTSNNITLLRHVAAFFVLITHSYDLTNNSSREFLQTITGLSMSFSKVGLIVFFFISGFLITQSLVNSSSILSFLWKRILRIYPALIVLMVLTTFILGPVFTTLSVKEYFTHSATWEFLLGSTLIRMRFVLPEVFNSNGVNGSLWSLPVEFRLYLLLALLSIVGLIKKRRLLFLFIIVFVTISIILTSIDFTTSIFTTLRPYLFWGTYFLTGSFVFFVKEKIRLDYKICLLLLILWYVLRNVEVCNLISQLVAFSYVTLILSFKTPVVGVEFFKRNDFSYSMYLYAYPLQQILIQTYPAITPHLLIIGTTILLIPFCLLSWKLIEKPALRFKNYV